MFENTLWQETLYLETAAILTLFLLSVGFIAYFLKDRSKQWYSIWASLKSWIFITPFCFVIFAFKDPWQLIFLILVSIYACKTFYQMVGMYHRSWFVYLTYAFLILQGFVIHNYSSEYYNIIPMIFFGCTLTIPLLRNSAKHMIQYTALAMMAFIFFGWSFLHLGRILNLNHGVYIVIYIFILAEMSENSSHIVTVLFGKRKLFSNITQRMSLEGFVFSFFFTIVIAFGLRRLLPDRSEPYWLSAGVIACVGGHIGNLFISFIRRDLGLKNTSIFIIGRGDIIDRLDKLIIIAPVFYYAFIYLEKSL